MNIYISHSRSFNFKEELYQPLKTSGLFSKHKVIFPHDSSIKSVDLKRLFNSKKCDLIIAEVSFPATGQGIELGWADYNNIPIICCFKKNNKISNSLKKITKQFINYKNPPDLIKKLTSKIE